MIRFVIYNLGKQVINTLSIIEEDCPFNVIKRDKKVNLHERDIDIFDIGGIIKAPVGQYNTKFRILETTVDELIGPEIVFKFLVTEGIFSSFFKS